MQIDDSTPVWNMGGSRLTLAAIAIIADALEKHGSVFVKGIEPDPEAPSVAALGFRIVHSTESGQPLTQAVPLEPFKEPKS